MKKLLMAAAVAFAALTGAANAAVIGNGSVSGALFGTGFVITGNGAPWEIGTTTTTIGNIAGGLLLGAADPYLGNPNNLLALHGGVIGGVGDPVTLSVTAFSVINGAVAFTVGVDGLTFTYTSESIVGQADGGITLLFDGTLTGDLSSTYVLGAAADFSVGCTQSAPTGSISCSFSLDTPPNPSIPEPASLALLGAGLVGLGFARRRRG